MPDAPDIPAGAPRLPILHHAADWLAVHKPSGLHTHPSALSPGEDSAARWLGQQLGQRVWPVHRLDRGASGLLLFALDAGAAGRLIQAFRERRVGKRYLCLCRGWPARDGEWLDDGLIERPLKDMDPASHEPALQEARTAWRCLARVEAPFPSGRGEHAYPATRVSLLECRPATGRMHQIRRHLAGLGHPLLGDGEHGDRFLNRTLAREVGLSRLALCCVELELVSVTPGEGPLRLRTRLDPDLERVLAALGLPDPAVEITTPPLYDGVLQKPSKAWRQRAARRAELALGTARTPELRPPQPATEQQPGPCVLCGAPAQPFHAEPGRHWRSCPDCGLVQLEPEQQLNAAAAEQRLRLHRNSGADAGYRDWLRPLAEALARRLPPGAAGVDLGCGPEPVLVELLRAAGLTARGWDPLFHPAEPPTPGQAWLSACEVFEHLPRPREELERWNDWLAPGGWLALSTGLLETDAAFPGWSYARDPAHVCVARPRTLEWLAERFGWCLEREGRVILFHKSAQGNYDSTQSHRGTEK